MPNIHDFRNPNQQQSPVNLEAEKIILGAIMMNNSELSVAITMIESRHFHPGPHRRIFESFLRINHEGNRIDEGTVCLELERLGLLDKCGGGDYITRLQEGVPSFGVSVEPYCKELLDTAIHRGLYEIGKELIVRSPDMSVRGEDLLADLGQRVSGLADFALKRSVIHTADEALKPQPPIEWILDQLYQPGTLNFDVGDGGTLKTYANLDRAVCISMGIPWLGRETRQTRVLIIDEENGYRRLARRLGDVMRGHDAPADIPLGFVCLPGLNLRISKDIDRLRALIEKYNAGYVLIDSWAAVIAGTDENTVAEVQPIIHELRHRIVDPLSIVLQIIHHTNREGKYRGTSALKDGVELMLQSERRPGNEIVYTSEKTRDSDINPFSATAHFDLGKFWMTPSDISSVSEKLTDAEKEVFDFIDKVGSATVDSVMRHASVCSPNWARQCIYNLAKRNKLKRIDDGGKGSIATFEVVRIFDPYNLSGDDELKSPERRVVRNDLPYNS